MLSTFTTPDMPLFSLPTSLASASALQNGSVIAEPVEFMGRVCGALHNDSLLHSMCTTLNPVQMVYLAGVLTFASHLSSLSCPSWQESADLFQRPGVLAMAERGVLLLPLLGMVTHPHLPGMVSLFNGDWLSLIGFISSSLLSTALMVSMELHIKRCWQPVRQQQTEQHLLEVGEVRTSQTALTPALELVASWNQKYGCLLIVAFFNYFAFALFSGLSHHLHAGLATAMLYIISQMIVLPVAFIKLAGKQVSGMAVIQQAFGVIDYVEYVYSHQQLQSLMQETGSGWFVLFYSLHWIVFTSFVIELSTVFIFVDSTTWTALNLLTWTLLVYLPRLRCMAVDMRALGWSSQRSWVLWLYEEFGLTKESRLATFRWRAVAVVEAMSRSIYGRWAGN
jgi:hypothetical protein